MTAVDGLKPDHNKDMPTPKMRWKIRQESMTTAGPRKVTGWKGLRDSAHFERLKTALFRSRGHARFDRAAADRILDDLRHVAYRRDRQAAEVFQFLDQDIIDADEDLSMAPDDLNRMSRNLQFLREVTAVVEEIESIRDEMSDEARVFLAAVCGEVGALESCVERCARRFRRAEMMRN